MASFDYEKCMAMQKGQKYLTLCLNFVLE